MAELISICLAALIPGSGVVVLALGFAGWLYWRRRRQKREEASPAGQRERLRREYWGQPRR